MKGGRVFPWGAVLLEGKAGVRGRVTGVRRRREVRKKRKGMGKIRMGGGERRRKRG